MLSAATDVLGCATCGATVQCGSFASLGAAALRASTESIARTLSWQQRSGVWICPRCVARTGSA